MKYLEQLAQSHEPLSVKEAAKIYGCSSNTFYKMIRRGEVPGAFRKSDKRSARINICPQEYVPWLLDQMATGRHPGVAATTRTNNGTNHPSTDAGRYQKIGNETSAVVKRIAKGAGSE